MTQTERMNIGLRGEWSADEREELGLTLTALSEYGVALSATDQRAGAGWTLAEVRIVHVAVTRMAGHALRAFQVLFSDALSEDDQPFCYRVLYAPLSFIRLGSDAATEQNDLLTNEKYRVVVGNLAFMPDSKLFTPTQLLMHEIAHIIGWRRRMILNGNAVYPQTLEKDLGRHRFSDGATVLLPKNSGILYQAKCSAENHEILADVILNDAENGFTVNTPGDPEPPFTVVEHQQGLARREQAQTVMSGVIRHRVENFYAEHPQADLLGTPFPLIFVNARAVSDSQRCHNLALRLR